MRAVSSASVAGEKAFFKMISGTFRAGGLLFLEAFIWLLVVGLLVWLAALGPSPGFVIFVVVGGGACVGCSLWAACTSRLMFRDGNVTAYRFLRAPETFGLAECRGHWVGVWWNAGGSVLELRDGRRIVRVGGVAVPRWGRASWVDEHIIVPRLKRITLELRKLGLEISLAGM